MKWRSTPRVALLSAITVDASVTLLILLWPTAVRAPLSPFLLAALAGATAGGVAAVVSSREYVEARVGIALVADAVSSLFLVFGTVAWIFLDELRSAGFAPGPAASGTVGYVRRGWTVALGFALLSLVVALVAAAATSAALRRRERRRAAARSSQR